MRRMLIAGFCQSIVLLCLMLLFVDTGDAQFDCCIEAAFVAGQNQIALTDSRSIHIFDFNFQHQRTIPIVASDMPDADIFYLEWGRSGDYFIIGNPFYNPETMPVALNALQVRRFEDNQVMAEFFGLGFQRQVDLVDWSLNDAYVAIGSATNIGYDSIKIITLENGATVNEIFIPHGQGLFALRWNPVLPQLAVAIGERDSTVVRLCHPDSRWSECSIMAQEDMNDLGMEYSPDGARLAFIPSGINVNSIAIFDIHTMQIETTLPKTSDFIQRFSWGAGGIAATTVDQKLYLWNPATAQTIAITTINYRPETLQWNPDGTLLLLSNNRRVELRNGATGALVAQCVACISHLSY